MKNFKIVLTLILLMGLNMHAYCQSANQQAKIKSIIVTEEKTDRLVKKQYKDSETYYDAKGNVLEEISYKEGKVTRHFKYQYDGDNNKIREDEYDSSGKIVESSEYKYQNGLRIEKVVYDTDKHIRLRKVYTYTLYQ
jgi:hypothetical protein